MAEHRTVPPFQLRPEVPLPIHPTRGRDAGTTSGSLRHGDRARHPSVGRRSHKAEPTSQDDLGLARARGLVRTVDENRGRSVLANRGTSNGSGGFRNGDSSEH
jgi:hypothetical protein